VRLDFVGKIAVQLASFEQPPKPDHAFSFASTSWMPSSMRSNRDTSSRSRRLPAVVS
jgi:hypothetical protein